MKAGFKVTLNLTTKDIQYRRSAAKWSAPVAWPIVDTCHSAIAKAKDAVDVIPTRTKAKPKAKDTLKFSAKNCRLKRRTTIWIPLCISTSEPRMYNIGTSKIE